MNYDNVLAKYNRLYNQEMSSLAHGTPTSIEELQAISIECAVKACQLNHYSSPTMGDLLSLAEQLRIQGQAY